MNFKRITTNILRFLVGQVSYRHEPKGNISLIFKTKIKSELSLCKEQLIFVGPKGCVWENLSQTSCLLYFFYFKRIKDICL